MIDRRRASAGVLAVAAACGLTACGAGGSAPTAIASTSAVAGSPVGSSTPDAPARSAADGVAAGACRTWALAMNQDSATRTTTVAAAARQAAQAARRDARWATLATDMTFVSTLPETGNSAADQHRAVIDEQDIGSRCATLGVTVGN